MSKKMNFKKILKMVSIGIISLIGLSFLLAKWYQKEMVAYVTESINKNLITPVSAFNVEVNFLSTFPSLGLTIKNMVFSDTSNGKQYPVLEIGKIKLVFGLAELVSGQALVHKVVVSDAYYHDYKDKAGKRYNLRIKRKETSLIAEENKAGKFYVPVIELHRIKIISENVNLGNVIKLNIDHAFGDFKLDRLGIFHISNAEGNLHLLRSGSIDLIEDAPYRISGILIMNPKNRLTSFETSSGIAAGLNIKLDGFVKHLNDTSNYQKLHISGSQNNTQFLSAFLPANLKKDILSNDSSQTNANLLMEGLKSVHIQPRTQITFKIKNGCIQNPNTLDGITDVDLSGKIITNDPNSGKAIIQLSGNSTAHFKTLDLCAPEPEYSALFKKYSRPDSIDKELRKSPQEIPDEIDLHVRCNIDHLKYQKANATAVSFDASLKNQIIQVEALRGNAFGGGFNLSTTLENLVNGGFNLSLEAQFNLINIQELFKQFNNFNQDYIRSEHIKGRTSFHISGKSLLSANLEPSFNKTNFAAEVSFDKLEVHKLPILINALSKANMQKQAEHIVLAKNELRFGLIRNVFYLAPAKISSSLSTFDVSAVQQINGQLDLIVKLNVADQFLTGKKRKLRELTSKNNDTTQRNWGFIFLHVSGRPQNINVEILKKETFELKRKNHHQQYLTAVKN
jgi:hypothetical protein